jgi:hypothetical protein
MIWRRPSAYSSMTWRASSNRDDLGVAGSSLSETCSSRGFMLALLGRDQKGPLI